MSLYCVSTGSYNVPGEPQATRSVIIVESESANSDDIKRAVKTIARINRIDEVEVTVNRLLPPE